MSHLRNVVCSLPSPELLSVCAHLVMAGLKVSRRHDAKKDQRSSPRLHPLREQLERYRDGLSSPRFLLRDNSYPDRGLRTINRRLMQDGKRTGAGEAHPSIGAPYPVLASIACTSAGRAKGSGAGSPGLRRPPNRAKKTSQ